MFLSNVNIERNVIKSKMKWHKWPDEKPEEMELCRILTKNHENSIIPIAFLSNGMWEDYDIFYVYKNVICWINEKEFDATLNDLLKSQSGSN